MHDPEANLLLKDILNEVRTLSVSVRRGQVEASMDRRTMIDYARDCGNHLVALILGMVAAIILLLWIGPALANEPPVVNSTADLRQLCRGLRFTPEGVNVTSIKRGFEVGLCGGIIIGVGLPCQRASGVDVLQGAEVFVAYADKHPERLHEPWKPVVRDALKEAFCK